MDVFVLSSVTEGICNSLLEAMATGLPVMVTNTGGNPEIVVDGQSGFLFPVGDVQQLTEKLIAAPEPAGSAPRTGATSRAPDARRVLDGIHGAEL